ncbi:MAG TPA: exodeoxyribonuclease III [Burkholderiaceae bacterium]|nr:exodeoxyribonuclease III [Burkholderiaceae bacterium]
MKLATWNVNSLNVRIGHVLNWLATNPVDALCLQETKLTDDRFPSAALEQIGYRAVFTGQKTYNGVAILSPHELHDVVRGMPDFVDEQQRVITATIDAGTGPVRVICAYFPNGQSVESDKYRYKLDWCDAMHGHASAELARHERVALLGDYNIAPEDRDVHDPAAWQGQVLCTDAERARFKALTALGLVDTFRMFEQPERTFSWWDYRQLAFQKNQGLRIDHILASQALAASCTSCVIDRSTRKQTQPSDHAPVVASFAP